MANHMPEAMENPKGKQYYIGFGSISTHAGNLETTTPQN